MVELYKQQRPKLFKHVIGQDDAIKSLSKMIEKGRIPQAILFSGPSGCGKTTLARILKKKLECDDLDFHEKNCADFRGIDMVRDVRTRMSLHAHGKCLIWLIDECHRLTSEAQDAFLKILEDTPKEVYFFLATTDPGKLKPTIITRCSPVRLKAIGNSDMRKIITHALTLIPDHKVTSTDVIDKVIDVAEGSARKALVLIDKILFIDEEDDQLECIQSADMKVQATALCKAFHNPKIRWPEVAAILKEIGDEDPEGIRRLVLAWFSKVCLGGNAQSGRAYQILDCFRDNYFDTGKAGLVISCYEVCNLA